MDLRLPLLWLSLTLLVAPTAAQRSSELLGRVSEAGTAEDRAERLIVAGEQALIEGLYEDALDIAELVTVQALESERDDLVARAHLIRSRCDAQAGHRATAVTKALQACAFAEEADIVTRARVYNWSADLFLRSGAAPMALDYARNTLSLQGLPNEEALEAQRIIGRAAMASGSYDEAHAAYSAQATMLEARKDQVGLPLVYQSLADLSLKKGDLEAARHYGQLLLALAEASGDNTERGVLRNNLGEIELRMHRTTVALAHFNEASTWLYGMTGMHERVLLNIAVANAELEQYTQALEITQHVLDLAERSGSVELKVRALTLRAGILLLTGDLGQVKEPARQAEALAEKHGLSDLQEEAVMVQVHLAKRRDQAAELEQASNKLDRIMLRRGEQEARERNARDELNQMIRKQEREVLDEAARDKRDRLMLMQAMLDAENQGKEMDLLRYEKELQQAFAAQEALAREKAQQQLELTQSALDAERKTRMIDNLEAQRSLQMLRVTRLELEQKDRASSLALLQKQNDVLESEKRAKEAEQRRDRIISRAAVAGAVLMLLVVGFVMVVMRKVRAKNRLIRQQVKQIGTINEELGQRNADLMDSINYARNIQGTIIPSAEMLQAELPDSFLFYRPRDVVSGDLPFMLRLGDRLFIAAIDCTGHGVPAAMLSFIAYYNLSEILRTRPDITVDEVLHELHLRVLHTNGRGSLDERVSDGMDIGLCSIDLRTGALGFAGAQMSMMLERDGVVTRVKGDVRAIGDRFGYGPPSFTLQHFHLGPNDRVYLFSDGIIHQFGGAEGRKKFSYARLSSLLTDLAGMPGAPSLEQVSSTFHTWKQNVEQTDDVLLLGFSLKGACCNANAA